MSLETRRKADRDRQRRKRERDAASGLASPRQVDEFLVRGMAAVLRERHNGKVGLAWRRRAEIGEIVERALLIMKEAGLPNDNPAQIARILHRLGDTSSDALLHATKDAS
jgi:hypothetical protein